MLRRLTHDPSSRLAEILRLTLLILGVIGNIQIFKVKRLPANGAGNTNRVSRLIVNLSELVFRHAHSFPQVESYCQTCGFQTEPLPVICTTLISGHSMSK